MPAKKRVIAFAEMLEPGWADFDLPMAYQILE